MVRKTKPSFDCSTFKESLAQHGSEIGQLSGWLFQGFTICFEHSEQTNGHDGVESGVECEIDAMSQKLQYALRVAKFAGAEIVTDLANNLLTHVVVGSNRAVLKGIREHLSRYTKAIK